MPIGQVQSNAGLIGTRVLDAQTLNNTGIPARQIQPLDLAGQSGGSGSGGVSLPRSQSVINSSSSETSSTFKTGVSSGQAVSLDQIPKTGNSISLGAGVQKGDSLLQVVTPPSNGLTLAPEIQTYTSVGKLTSEASSATGNNLNAVA